MKTFFKQKTFRSAEFLQFAREQECFACGAPPPNDPSHYGGYGKSGGMGLKADDLFVATLCRTCHRCFGDTGRLPIPGGIRTLQDLDAPARTFDPQMSRALHIEANRDLLAKFIRERLAR